MTYRKAISRIRTVTGSVLYGCVFCLSTVILATALCFCFFLPFRQRYAFAKFWGWVNATALKLFCGMSYRIEGVDNIPADPVVILAKHQSTYETMVLTYELMPMAWVAKKELLWVPFFGWAFRLAGPIMIDRKAKTRAVDQIVEQGTRHLKLGRSVLIFPEGTRKSPGSQPGYRLGGAFLAVKSGFNVLPVAHNAGEFWPRKSFLKWPGTVTFSIGPVIETASKDPKLVTEQAQSWIENKMSEISDPGRRHPAG